MFKMHDSGHSYDVDVSYLARRYFTNALKMRWSCEGKYKAVLRNAHI